MTSDRGNASEGTEVTLSSPVTPKTPTTSLNPNANVFQIKKSSTPPPAEDNLLDTLPVPSTDPLEQEPDGFMNGDGGGVTFPPTPESPDMPPQDYSELNGGSSNSSSSQQLDTQLVFQVDSPAQSTTAATTAAATTDDTAPLEGTIPDDHLRALIKNQLEYYFSRENLANDSYLISQMDADRFVLISTVASFRQVKRLTNNVDLVVDVLRESPNVQVDDPGEKVRPLHKRCIVILREIPATTPIEDVKNLFNSEKCPKFASCEFAHNDNWYVTFETEDQAQGAYQYLREEVRNFLGKPIMARIKAKPLVRNSFGPKNGFKSTYDPNQMYPSGAAPVAAATSPKIATAPLAAAGTSVVTSTAVYPPPVVTASVSYINPTVSQNLPFFPPNPPLPMWHANPVAYYDPGTVFAANGYTPTATFRLNNTANNKQGYQNMRSSRHERNSKPNRFQQQSSQLVNSHHHHHHHSGVSTRDHHHHHHHHQQVLPLQQQHDRYHGDHRPQRHSAPRHERPIRAEPYATGDPRASPPPAPTATAMPMPDTGRLSDGAKEMAAQRGGRNFRGRRRRQIEEDGAKRGGPAQPSKDSKPANESFEWEDNSFPPLPGATSNNTTNDVFINKMSDVVKGVKATKAKASVREVSSSISTAVSSVVSTASSSTTTTAVTTSSSPALPTPPQSPYQSGKSPSPDPSSSKAESASSASTATTTTTTTVSTAATATQASSSSSSSSSSSGGSNQGKSPTPKQDDASKSTSENGPPKMSYALIVAKAKAKKDAESSSDSSSNGGSSNNGSKKCDESPAAAATATATGGDSDKEQADNETDTLKFETARGRGGRSSLPGRNSQYRSGTARRDYDRMPVRK